MFRWCAYCGSFLGERAPLDDFTSTHGICTSCEAGDELGDGTKIERARAILRFHRELVSAATGLTEERLPAVPDLLERGRSLQLSGLDLLLGSLQPVLYEVGRLWEAQLLAPSHEARFTAFSEALLDALTAEQAQRLPSACEELALLAPAEGNRHTVGIRMLAFSLREAGKGVSIVTSPIAADLLAAQAVDSGAHWIGISIAQREEVRYAAEVARCLVHQARSLPVVVGGAGARGLGPMDLPPGLRLGAATSFAPAK